MDDDYLIKGDV